MERKVGEVFHYEGNTYEVISTNCGCKECCFSGTGLCSVTGVLGSCSSYSRSDGNDVIFVKKGRENSSITLESVTKEIIALHERKNHDYGNAFAESFKEFGEVSAVIRLNDKMNRLKSLMKSEAMVKDESIEDTLIDLASYAIMTVVELRNKKK